MKKPPLNSWPTILFVLCTFLQFDEICSQVPNTAQGRITIREYDAETLNLHDFWNLHAGYPDSPDRIWYPNLFEWPAGPDGNTEDVTDNSSLPAPNVRDKMGWEIRGYLHPPSTDTYYFAISADEKSELWLSTDSDIANLELIAIEPSWNKRRQFASEDRRERDNVAGRLVNHSVGIPLEEGNAYAILARAVDFGGPENLGVAWNIQGPDAFRNGQVPISGQFLSTFDRADVSQPFFRFVTGSLEGFSVVLNDGHGSSLDGIDVNPTSLSVILDGQAVPVEVTKRGAQTTLTHRLDGRFFESESKHGVVISFNEQTVTSSFSVPPYATVPVSARLDGYQSDNRGFIMRIVQTNENLPNNIEHRERHLAGLLTDNRKEPLENLVDPSFFNENGVAEIEGVINFDQEANPSGVFRKIENGGLTNVADKRIPGIPGVEGGTDNVTAEILTILEVPTAGLYNFAFNSDDGFRTTIGFIEDSTKSILVGEFNGGRGYSTTYSLVVFDEPGFYNMRSLWFEGGGGANLEWWLADQEGNPLGLLNDGAGGLRTFRDIPSGLVAIKSIHPKIGSDDISTSGIDVSVTIKNGPTSIRSNSVTASLNHVEFAPVIDRSNNVVTIMFHTGELDFDTDYRWEIQFPDGSTQRSVTGTFRTMGMQFGALMFIETEDFNYGLGLWDRKNPIGMTDKYLGGTYQNLGDGMNESDVGAGTSFGVDYFESDNNNSESAYRPGTGVEVAKAKNNEQSVFRGGFNVEINHVVTGNEPGDWLNYTRRFPEPDSYYNIFGYFASGGDNIDVSLLRVTGDPSKPNQSAELIGSWRQGPTRDGGEFEILPLLDENGVPLVAKIGGTTTLRLLANGGDHASDYLTFVPAAPPPPQRDSNGGIKTITNNGDGTVTIVFTGTLTSSSNIEGPYRIIPGATPPYTIPASANAHFYR